MTWSFCSKTGKSASSSFRNDSRGFSVPDVRISVRMLQRTNDWGGKEKLIYLRFE
jgi:hypothetical protein